MEESRINYSLINRFKPKVYVDGNKWCALYGDDIISGVVGFGKTPTEALENFCEHMTEEMENKQVFESFIKVMEANPVRIDQDKYDISTIINRFEIEWLSVKAYWLNIIAPQIGKDAMLGKRAHPIHREEITKNLARVANLAVAVANKFKGNDR